MKLIKTAWHLPLISAILLILSWPPLPFPYLIFVAFIPLLRLTDLHEKQSELKLYGLKVYLSLLLWNIGTTWWVWHASPEGSVAAFTLNALLQTLPWLSFRFCQRMFTDKLAYPALISFWLAVEYLHFEWDLAWPWLALGNVFSSRPDAVQWYEITGVSGGSVWILSINIMLYLAWKNRFTQYRSSLAALIIAPLLLSIFFKKRFENKNHHLTPVEVVVVQPNIDPYTDKFDGIEPLEQVKRMIELSDSLMSEQTQLVLWPETSITESIIEEQVEQYASIMLIRDWLSKHPNISLVAGASTYHFFSDQEPPSATARQTANGLHYYDAYNTALLISHQSEVQFYHKSKLVPGVEKMPYPRIFGFLEKLSINLGGASGSLARSDSALVFKTGAVAVAPVICYESVFGDYVTQYNRNGANLLAIITNDGWWKNTPGYKQHFEYARLRSIENRQYIARAANTGISGFINPLGKVMSKTQWWVPDAQKALISPRKADTFYAQTGDFIGKICATMAVLILLSAFVRTKSKKGY